MRRMEPKSTPDQSLALRGRPQTFDPDEALAAALRVASSFSNSKVSRLIRVLFQCDSEVRRNPRRGQSPAVPEREQMDSVFPLKVTDIAALHISLEGELLLRHPARLTKGPLVPSEQFHQIHCTNWPSFKRLRKGI